MPEPAVEAQVFSTGAKQSETYTAFAVVSEVFQAGSSASEIDT